ncbi:MAG: hypothetical protein PHF67_01725 [Candidatus Nanoarchaeia archaeon]|nr:hypothetical protein [Candidatus Nanoarchaeia archaeon]
MKNPLAKIAATTTMVLALVSPAYAADQCSTNRCPRPIRDTVESIGVAIADLNAKVWENTLVRAHERAERQSDRLQRTLLNAQYKILDNEYHKQCVPHYHLLQPNKATFPKPMPFDCETNPRYMFPANQK